MEKVEEICGKSGSNDLWRCRQPESTQFAHRCIYRPPTWKKEGYTCSLCGEVGAHIPFTWNDSGAPMVHYACFWKRLNHQVPCPPVLGLRALCCLRAADSSFLVYRSTRKLIPGRASDEMTCWMIIGENGVIEFPICCPFCADLLPR